MLCQLAQHVQTGIRAAVVDVENLVRHFLCLQSGSNLLVEHGQIVCLVE